MSASSPRPAWMMAAFGLAGLAATGLTASACSRPEPAEAETFVQTEVDVPTEVDDPEAEQATLAVEGMVCQSCANAAAQAASDLPGVISARGDFEAGTLEVSYLPAVTDPVAIAAAITATDRGDAPAFTASVRL